jgi:hypothetical protein
MLQLVGYGGLPIWPYKWYCFNVLLRRFFSFSYTLKYKARSIANGL